MKALLGVNEVADICHVKMSKAYSIIRQINDEMEANGYLVIKGRVNREYLFKRLGITEDVLH
jgi:hypothetical protein